MRPDASSLDLHDLLKKESRSTGDDLRWALGAKFDFKSEMTKLKIPPELAATTLGDLTRDQLLEILEANSESGIRISFAGKSNARRIAHAVRPRVSRVIAKLSVGDPAQRAANKVIDGDNLQAMASLYKDRGNIDFILTDPPYNTGNDFRYNDRWEEDPNDPGMGDIVSSEDGARHTKWMRFMWPRLQMMKAMLKPEGVLAICIDHRELFRLGQMLDELFDHKNRLAIINWQKSYAPKNNVGKLTHVSTSTEYVLVYAKSAERAKTNLLPRGEETNARYTSDLDGDPEPWTPGDLTGPGAKTHAGQVYGVQNPFTGEICYPSEGRCWAAERARMKAMLEMWGCKYESKDLNDGKSPALMIQGSLKSAKKNAETILARGKWPIGYWRDKGKGAFRLKKYLKDVKSGIIPMTYWADEDYETPLALGTVSWDHEQSGHSQAGITELSSIVGKGHEFETVKPLKLFTKLIQIWCPENGTVLDPFAGSGTTGHAVMLGNQMSGASRRFILLERGSPENGDSYARTLLADRLKRVISGAWVNGQGAPVPGGFTFCSLEKKVDAGTLLRMERDEMVDTVIASHFDATRRRGDSLILVEAPKGKPFKYLVAKNSDDEGFFLVWDGPDKNTDFTENVYEVCAKEARLAGLKSSSYHVYARLYRFQTEGIRFYQIPDQILADFGLDLKSEPFVDEGEAEVQC